jgi:hypothetical protein
MYDLDVAYLKGELTKNRLDVAAILNQFRHSSDTPKQMVLLKGPTKEKS